ncbi:MAG: hypothetical protein ACR2IF_09795 [Terriglobales bacterium]
MQLQFTRDEVAELVELLQSRTGEGAERLLDRLMDHDYRFDADELDDLARCLRLHIPILRESVGHAVSIAARIDVTHRVELLQHALDHVVEACAMV